MSRPLPPPPQPPTDTSPPVIAHADAPGRWTRATWRRLITTRHPGNNQSVAPCAAHAPVSFTGTPAVCQMHAAGKSKERASESMRRARRLRRQSLSMHNRAYDLRGN